jgi:hypothetical protein
MQFENFNIVEDESLLVPNKKTFPFLGGFLGALPLTKNP